MNYLINFVSGACQWSDNVDMASMASLISAGAVYSVIDISAKKALISNNIEGSINIGWASIPEYAAFDSSQLAMLENNVDDDLESE